MGQNVYDGSKVDTTTLMDVGAGKGIDGLAHPFQMDADGKLRVNVQGFLSGGLTPTTDGVFIGLQTTPLVAEGVFNTSGNNSLVSATVGKSVQVLGYEIQAKNSAVGTQTVKFFDTTPSQITGSPEWDFNAREGVVSMAPPGTFKFQGGVGLGLHANLSVSQPVMVHVIYTLV
jgi:hypothetical protein